LQFAFLDESYLAKPIHSDSLIGLSISEDILILACRFQKISVCDGWADIPSDWLWRPPLKWPILCRVGLIVPAMLCWSVTSLELTNKSGLWQVISIVALTK